MNIAPGNAQHMGNREEQQDAFAFSDISNKKFIEHGGVLAVVADGMGGLAKGRAASSLAVRTLLKEYEAKTKRELVIEALARSAARANQAVYEMAMKAGMEGNAGTTLAAAVVHQGNLCWLSAGDSRIYLFRDGELSRITVDHNYALELERDVANGKISRDEAENNPERNHLISFLGLRELIMTDSSRKPFPLRRNDRILLCSDGLHGSLSDAEIAEELNLPPQQAAERLVQKVLRKGKRSQDNVTVLIAAFDPVAVKKQQPERMYWKSIRTVAALAIFFGAGFAMGRYTDLPTSAIQQSISIFNSHKKAPGKADISDAAASVCRSDSIAPAEKREDPSENGADAPETKPDSTSSGKKRNERSTAPKHDRKQP